MPTFIDAKPQISVRLYKTISRKTIDGQTAVSSRYAGKDEFIDLTGFMGEGSVVRTSKSVREPAGGFVIQFADMAHVGGALSSLETVYGLVEPMDVVEIRMWGGVGLRPNPLPIVMRGFVSAVQRSQAMGDNGKPVRTVVVSGQDYGKIWQMYQVIYLAAYAEGRALLTTFALFEMFGVGRESVMKAADFVREVVGKVINPHIEKMLPEKLGNAVPRKLTLGDGITVAHGKVSGQFHQQQGSIYDILRYHGDVGHWNELFTEDREDGVHVVYRPVPDLHLTLPSGAKNRKIQEDAPDPIYCTVPDDQITALNSARSDANVANFYWVNNQKYDLIDDMQRKLASIGSGDTRTNLEKYPNSAAQYYGSRAMYAETNQSADAIKHEGGRLSAAEHAKRSEQMEAWIFRRLRILAETNRDNVVLESGSIRCKGGVTRPGGTTLMRAGDYVRVQQGQTTWDAYAVQVDHEFSVFSGYHQTLTFERGEGFARRVTGSDRSPWLAEQATRIGGVSV